MKTKTCIEWIRKGTFFIEGIFYQRFAGDIDSVSNAYARSLISNGYAKMITVEIRPMVNVKEDEDDNEDLVIDFEEIKNV